ncbi:homeodomain-interacting protein kinase 1-like [Lampris incognitus]|uniref:homeodomain-interacting protein kinase 1-like n=1 Tax=Lampris incognitus TaxID=2546036 RepID=UPI0024B5BDB7|nr:homeodomain-interacting protein kinase 1-like [Lampris incognitus]XP_056130254.1 homeodomain-interacting protein kinase 1-like [Lampris incognitus]
MLKVVSSLDPDAHNIVRFHEGFFYRGLTCLVFEQLHMSLLDYMRQTHCKPLSLNEIRPITVQLATAFTALKSIGLIHTDLKLDNIMLVDQVSQPFRVKLIDFGLAVPSSEVQRGSILQPLGYRAPEVVLGLPISEAIDMWSLGCVMAAMFLGRNLYPSWEEFDMMRAIVATQGMPADHLLDAGLRTRCLFTRDSNHQTWRLKLPWEYFRDTGKSPRCPSRFSLGSLDVLLKCKLEGADEHEEEDIQAFVDLLKRMLTLDAAQRITPSQALRHRFLSMTHLAMGYHHSSYVMDSFDIMSICPLSESSWGSEINETCSQQDQNPMTSLTDANGGGDDKEEGDIKGTDDKLEGDIEGGDDKEEGDIEGGDDKEEGDIKGDDKEAGDIEGGDDKEAGNIEGGDDKEEGDIEGGDVKEEENIKREDGVEEGNIERENDEDKGDTGDSDKEGLIQREGVEKKGDRRENGGGEQKRSEGAGCRDKIDGEKGEGLKRESKRKGGKGGRRRWRKSWRSRKRKGKDEEEGKEEKAEEAGSKTKRTR